MVISRNEPLANVDFLSGITLLVDKPMGWTSFDVVGKLRGLLRKKLQRKNIKVGHAGTLDPLATGLLIVAIGKDTQKISQYQESPKTYKGTIRLGATTPSADAETEPDCFFAVDHIDDPLIERTRLSFVGKIQQKPPVYSAVKVDGMRAYKLAREGVEFETRTREVEIFSFNIAGISMPDIHFDVHCQKGTYIRSLASDFGMALKSGAYLTSLCRTAIGEFRLEDAWTVAELEKELLSGSVNPD
jgi:tRNA pseudouridine55 synthase